MESGVATRPIADFKAYRDQLTRFVYQSGSSMEPVFAVARRDPKRVAYAEGEDERVLRAAQVAVDEGIARPVLIGRTDIITARVAKLGLRLKLGENCEGVNILDDPRYRDAGSSTASWRGARACRSRRRGRRCARARRSSPRSSCTWATPTRCCAARCGDYRDHLQVSCATSSGRATACRTLAAMQMLILPGRQLFVCDTHVNRDPTAEEIAEMTLLAAEEVQRFGLKPIVALLSHSNFGSSDAPSAQKMRDALAIVLSTAPGLAVEGEMHADAALSKAIRDREFPGLASGERCEPADHAERRCRQHHIQRVARGRRGRDHGRRDPARRGEARAHHDAFVHRPTDRQHDRGRGGRRVCATERG